MKLKRDQLTIPNNYFKLPEEEKHDVCLGVLEVMYELLVKKTDHKLSKLELMERILDATLEHNESLEEYESCQVLLDSKKLLDESTSE